MKIVLISLIIIFSWSASNAAIFRVTTNANDGVGSLRQAILDANANGTATSDLVRFDIAAAAIDDVIIVLTTGLPNLSSNLVIDATTQSSAFLGNTSIKIRLVRGSADFFCGFNLDGVSDVAIYGFYFNNFLSQRGVPSDERKAGIYLNNCARIIIGSPGKQNGFGGNYTSILSPTALNTLENITISSNIIGLDATGNVIASNVIGIDLSYLSNSTIGGTTAAYGNLISANENGAASLGALRQKVVFQHNVIGLDINKTRVFYSAQGVGVFANGEFVSLSILNNDIVGQDIGIRIDNIKTKFTISQNKIGSGPNDENFRNSKYGIELYNCNAGLINENRIGYNPIGLYMDLSYPISILKNSFFCNVKAMEVMKYPTGKSTSPSRITYIDATGARGSYLPNSKVELFYTDDCSADCQGKDWVATVNTGADGQWVYSGTISGKLTSLGTNAEEATATTFSKPFIDGSSALATGVKCGEFTGTIAIDVYDASMYSWINRATGLQVSNQRMLTGVTNGIYYLRAGNGGKCDVFSQDITIDGGTNGINDLKIEKNKTFCGSETGYIRNITVSDNLSRIWYRVGGGAISREDNLEGVSAGSYFFTIGEGPCKVISKTYVIENTEIFYGVNADQISIKNATCGESNGSITVHGYRRENPDRIKWFDQRNNELTSTQTISGLGPGKYKLVGYSNNSCTNTIGEYIVTEISSPVIDYSALQKKIGCDGKTASTFGINVLGSTGPYIYTWVDDRNNRVSNQLNLTNAPLGNYKLFVTDKNGCTIEGNLLDFNALASRVLNIPNSISPNGDGVNDVWQISGVANHPLADFSIYNRTGARIFYSRGYRTLFDGTFNGSALQAGVYYYVIDLHTDCDTLSGSLTIIR